VLHEPDPPSDPEEPIDDLVERRRAAYLRKHASAEAHKIRRLTLPDDRPIGILHVGDPHVDDDGCDLGQLAEDLETVTATDGLWAGCVGDVTNAWIGRLAALYAGQGTTRHDAIRLTEWMLGRCPWLYLVLGNHDHWGEGAEILALLMRGVDVRVRAAHEARVVLHWPTAGEIRLHVRHDFPGNSQWNPNHALDKRATLEPWAHLLVCGHRHTSYQDTGPGINHWRTCVRVAGYKVLDDYAESKGFLQYPHRPSALTILDPSAPDGDRVRVRWDVQEGARELTWLRGGAL
jgi:hypothetical protein